MFLALGDVVIGFCLTARNRLTLMSSKTGWCGMGVARIQIRAVRRVGLLDILEKKT